MTSKQALLLRVQRADRRLNAQLLDSELDDTLESFEGSCNLGSSAVAAVRGSANKQSMGVSREKDKADRATYQTVLDPRTRLVCSCQCFCLWYICCTSDTEDACYDSKTLHNLCSPASGDQ